MSLDTTQTPTPLWFVFRGPWRAEFVSFSEAFDWARAHGGTLTCSPTNEPRMAQPVAPAQPKPFWLDRGYAPTAGNIAAADLCGSSCGEE